MSDRLLLALAFFEMLERLLLRFLLSDDDCLTFRVLPSFTFAADRRGWVSARRRRPAEAQRHSASLSSQFQWQPF